MPSEHCVYVLTDNAGAILYVGQSSDIIQRIANHKASKKIPFVHWFANYCEEYRKEQLEAELIQLHRPPFNKHIPRLMRSCRECGRPFRPRRPNQIYHSLACKAKVIERLANLVAADTRCYGQRRQRTPEERQAALQELVAGFWRRTIELAQIPFVPMKRLI